MQRSNASTWLWTSFRLSSGGYVKDQMHPKKNKCNSVAHMLRYADAVRTHLSFLCKIHSKLVSRHPWVIEGTPFRCWWPPISSPTRPLQDRFGFVQWHPADAQRPHLRSSPQALQTHCNFPPFFLRKDEDIALALLVSNVRSKDM